MKQLLIIISFLCTTVLSAQDMKEQVRQLFAEGTTLKWVEHYRGRINDINDIAMTIGFDGHHCKGYLYYLRSKDKLKVEGTIQDTILNLLEYNAQGIQTGSITGSIKDFEGIAALWQNYDKSLSEELQMLSAVREPRYPGYCGDNKWIRHYSGDFEGGKIDVLLVRSNNGLLKGTMYNNTTQKTFLVEGTYLKKKRSIVLDIRDLNWKAKGQIVGFVDFHTDDIKGHYKLTDDTRQVANLYVYRQLAVGCIEYADFLTKTEITYPKTRNQDFNDLLRERIQDWLTSSRAYTKQYAEQIAQLAPSQRASLRSYCWYDMDFLSDSLISGIITQSNTWDNQYQGFTFNFDLVTNQEITKASLFRADSGYESAIQQYILGELQNRPYNEDPDYMKWIQTAQFPYFTIRKDGLVFRSDFNSTYGEQQVVIPFDWLKAYLKTDSSILSWIE